MNAPDCACIASGAGSIEIILIGSGPHGGGAVVARYFLCRKLRQTSFDYPLPKQFIAWKQPAAHMAAARSILSFSVSRKLLLIIPFWRFPKLGVRNPLPEQTGNIGKCC